MKTRYTAYLNSNDDGFLKPVKLKSGSEPTLLDFCISGAVLGRMKPENAIWDHYYSGCYNRYQASLNL